MRKKKAAETEQDICKICLEKDTEKCRTCEHGIKRALEKKDAEDMSRQVAVEIVEGALEIEYQRGTYIQQAKFFLNRTIEDILKVGSIMLILKEKEGYGEFMKIVEDDIGIPYRTAARFMNTAAKAKKYPALNFGHMAKVGHVYALLEAPEEELKEFEEKGILAGKTTDELQRLSVKEMRVLIQKLKTEVEQIVQEETKGLKAEKKALVTEVERLRAFDPGEKEITWAAEQMMTITKYHDDLFSALRKVALDDRLLEYPELMAKIEGEYKEIRKRTQIFEEDWNRFLTEGLESVD